MEITGAEREIDDISDSGNKNGGTFEIIFKMIFFQSIRFIVLNHIIHMQEIQLISTKGKKSHT